MVMVLVLVSVVTGLMPLLGGEVAAVGLRPQQHQLVRRWIAAAASSQNQNDRPQLRVGWRPAGVRDLSLIHI